MCSLSLSYTENARGDFTYEIKRLKFWLKALAGFAVNLLTVQDPKMDNIFYSVGGCDSKQSTERS